MYDKVNQPFRACIQNCPILALTVVLQLTLLVFAISPDSILSTIAYFLYIPTTLVLFDKLASFNEVG